MREVWKALNAEGTAEYEAAAAEDKERYERECKEAGIDPNAKRAKVAEGAASSAAGPSAAPSASHPSLHQPLQPLQPQPEKAPKVPKEKKKTAKQEAVARLRAAIDKSQMTLRERVAAIAMGGVPSDGPPVAKPEPCGILPLNDETLATGILEVHLFTKTFSKRLQFMPCQSPADLCMAISFLQRPSCLRSSAWRSFARCFARASRLVHSGKQQPPPLDKGLILQQLPSPSSVNPATWAEVLRSIGHLLTGFGDAETEMKNPRDALCEETLLQEALSALGGHTEVVLNLDEEERSEERAKERTMQLGNLGYDEDEIKEMDHKAATAILREPILTMSLRTRMRRALGYCSTFGELLKMKRLYSVR